MLQVVGLGRRHADKRSSVGAHHQPAKEARAVHNVSNVVYPPRDPGVPIRRPSELVDDQRELLQMLRLHAAESPARFDLRFLAPVTRLASLLNTLPATPSSSFGGAGGLFCACFETAVYSFRASDGRIFSGSMGVEDRHRLEGRWRYVCFVAGLMYPIGASLSAMTVLGEDGSKWTAELEDIVDWCDRKGSERVYVSWASDVVTPGPSSLTATFALRLLGRENAEWLNEGSSDLITSLLDIISGAGHQKQESIATGLVRTIWASVQEREMARRLQNYGRLTIGTHVSPYLLDALIGLAKGKWEFQRSVLFADTTGVYLQWPEAGLDIIAYCEERGYKGIPQSEQALLALMIRTDLVVAGVDNLALFEIAGKGGEIVTGVKLKNHDLVIPDDSSLQEIAGERKVLLSEVLANDPLSRAQNTAPGQAKPRASSPAAQPPAAPASTSPPVPGELRFEELRPEDVLAADPPDSQDPEDAMGQDEASEQEQPPAPSPAIQRSDPPSRPPREKAPGAINEGPEIKYSELLPEDVRTKFKKVDAELLGRLVHIWRRKDSEGRVMRVCEHGVAFELALLADYTQDPPGFLSTLGSQGFLFTERSTPGKMIYPVAAAEGSKKSATCFIIAHHAAKRLGMP